jgi:dTDP-4-dehydrorhamnose reductase
VSTVLITGAEGLLGLELVAVLRRAGYDVVASGRDGLDVTDARACARALRELGPRTVIDCTTLTPERLPRVGALATACARVNAYVIAMSCVDVFDGLGDRPYVESDRPAPSSPFGAAKLATEEAVARANPRHAIVRASWLFGAHRRCFCDDLLDAARGRDRLPVDASVRSTPMYTRHLAEALVRLVRRPAYGVFHATAGDGGTSMLQFARALFSALGVPCEPVAAVPGTGPSAGAAPASLVLDTRRAHPLRLPDWRMGLGAYVSERPPDPTVAGATPGQESGPGAAGPDPDIARDDDDPRGAFSYLAEKTALLGRTAC